MTEPSWGSGARAQRIGRLPGYFASAMVGLGPDEIEAAIEALLGQLGEDLSAERVALFATANQTPLKCWARPDTVDGDPARKCLVTGPANRVCALSVERSGAGGGVPWPPAVEDHLQLLADLMALAIERAEQMRELAALRMETRFAGVRALRAQDEGDADDFEDIVGDSPALRVALNRVLEVASTDASVVILGETGTGKELFARAVHSRSGRRGHPFVRVNCAALPPTLIESELFGHERGAFTGAVSMRQGRFELADGGTIFLDEIGDLTPDVQVKFLRVLQEGEFERVGSSQTRRVDVRVIAATHQDLEAAVADGRFRADLFYRLSVYPIRLPSLQERVQDIPLLVWFF